MKVYVGNMSADTTKKDLKLACEAFGKVESVTIIKDKLSSEPKVFGYVEMSSIDECQAVIDGLNGKELKGSTLKVNDARPRTENFRVGRGGYGGGKREGFGSGKGGGYGGGKGGYGGGGKGGFSGGRRGGGRGK
jgi:RNA recognition motif-containing protein|tara:strand:+ start:231 stop:632 length:402 start_codon:yes stop_codon:yes gene_type:complete